MGTTTTNLGLYKPAFAEENYDVLFGSSMDVIDDIPGKPRNRTGLTGATSSTRFVGGTASVAPTTGTFVAGDYVISQTGHVYICTVSGSPGTWVDPITLIDVWVPFTIPGTLTAGLNGKRLPIPGSCSVVSLRTTLETAASTGTTTTGLLRDGSTAMFSSNPSIAAGANISSSSGTPIGSPTLTTSNWLQVTLTAVGTGAAGLTGMIGLRRT